MTSLLTFLLALTIFIVTGFLAQVAITLAWFWYCFDSEPLPQTSPDEGKEDKGGSA